MTTTIMDLRKFFTLIFDIDVKYKISRLNLQRFVEKHLAALVQNNTGGKYDVMITATSAAFTDFFGNIEDKHLAVAIQKSKTRVNDLSLQQFIDTVDKYYNLIAFKFPKDTPEYLEFFPRGKSEYDQVTKANALVLMDTIISACTAHVAEITQAVVDEFTAIRTSFSNSRTEQLQKMEVSDAESSEIAATRAALEFQLNKNILTLAFEYLGDVDRGMDFFDQQYLGRTAATGKGTTPAPTPTPIPSGVIKFDIDETILADIFPKIAGNASATGVEQLNFDHGDGYETVYTLQNGILTGYTIAFNTAGVYHAEVTEITAGANGKIAVIQFDNCKLSGTLTIPPDVQPSNIEVPMNPLLLALDMQQESYTNLTSFVVFGCGLLSINEHLIGLDNSGKTNGFANFSGGTNAAPSGLGIAAKNSLIAKGWTVLTN